MKNIKILLITFIINFCFILNVFAQGNVSISTNSLNITKGESKTFTITSNNSAGRIDISSTDNSIASVSKSSTFLDMTSDTITVTANSVGTTTIKVYIADMTTYDDEDLSGKTYTINVNVSDVVKEETKKEDNNVSSNNNVSDNQNNNSNNNINEKITTKSIDKKSNKSNNTNLKELKVDGFELDKIDDSHYSLNVNNSVKNINVLATAEDNNAKVNGIGLHELNIGKNEINIEIVANDGTKKTILLSVNRYDKLIISDLKEVINNKDIEDIEIYIDSDTIISKEDLKLIKESKRKVIFSFYDEDNKKIYSWIVDGKKIDKLLDVDTTIVLNENNIKKIKQVSNYADGVFINFNHNGSLPNGVSIKIYVGDKFDNGDVVSVYYYNENKNTLELKIESVKVQEEYVEFSIEHCSNYFVTMSNLKTNNNKSNNVFPLIIISELVIVFGIIIVYILKAKKIKPTN